MLKPYIGVTDVMAFNQVEALLDTFKEKRCPTSKRLLHVGVMCDSEMIRGNPEAPWAHRWPHRDVWREIFAAPEAYNCLHYANYSGDFGLGKTLSEAIGYCGMYLSAVQLDMMWPNPAEIANAVHISRKSVEVILQVGTYALDEIDNDPRKVAKRLEDYEGVIHRVLLDKSAGKGLGMNANALLPFARAIRERFPTLGLVFAGGLGPTTMSLIDPLLLEFPDLSIDAQGKLHPSGTWKLDNMSIVLAQDYLTAALERLP